VPRINDWSLRSPVRALSSVRVHLRPMSELFPSALLVRLFPARARPAQQLGGHHRMEISAVPRPNVRRALRGMINPLRRI